MIKKQFFTGLSWLILLNLIIKPIWIFGIDRQVQNEVGREAYGHYFALYNLSYVLLFLADGGISNLVLQKVAGGVAVSPNQLFRFKFFLLFLYGVACCFTGWLTGISRWDLFAYLIIIQALTSLFLFFRSLLTANQYYKTDAFFSVVDKALMILLCGLSLLHFLKPLSLLFFLQGQLAATLVATTSLAFVLLQKKLISHGNSSTYAALIKSLSPFVAIILLMSVHFRLDGFLLERLRPDGAQQAGVYAGAYRLLDAGNMVGYLSAAFLVAFIARNQKDKKMVQDVVLRVRHFLLLAAIATVAFTGVFASWTEQLLYHTSDPFGSKVMALCIASLPAYYLVHIYGSVLTATASFSAFIRILFLAVTVNVFLNLYLIPLYGAVGCCLAALASQYLCGAVCFTVATSKTGISHGWRSLAAYFFVGMLLFAGFAAGKILVPGVWIILGALLFIIITGGFVVARYTKLSFLHSTKQHA